MVVQLVIKIMQINQMQMQLEPTTKQQELCRML